MNNCDALNIHDAKKVNMAVVVRTQQLLQYPSRYEHKKLKISWKNLTNIFSLVN